MSAIGLLRLSLFLIVICIVIQMALIASLLYILLSGNLYHQNTNLPSLVFHLSLVEKPACFSAVFWSLNQNCA